MKGIRIAAITLTCSLVFSCTSVKKLEQQSVNNKSIKYDSIYVSKIIKLDTLITPRSVAIDSVSLDVLKSLGKYVVNNERAHTTLEYRDGQVIVNTICDSMLHVYIQEIIESMAIQNKLDQSSISNSVIQSETKNPMFHLPWWIWILMILTFAIWGFKLYKYFTK